MRAAIVAVVVAWAQVASAKDTPWERSGIDWTKVPPMAAESAFQVPRAKRLELSNGIDLLVVEKHDLPIVSVRLVVAGAGSAGDPTGKAGLAALTADMLDEGAGGMSALEISEEIDRLGSSLSVWADLDGAHVGASALARNLDRTIQILSKVVIAPDLDAKEFERVFGDVKMDLVLRRDQAPALAALVSATVVFGPESPYGHPPAGLLADVERLGIEDVRAFFAAKWVPSATTIVVAGDVDPDKVGKTFESAFGKWKGSSPVVTPTGAGMRKPAAPPFVRFSAVDRPGAAQTQLALGVKGVPRSDPRYHALELYTTILGGSFTSRLVQRLREDLGYTYGIRAALRWLQGTGMLVIRSGVFTPTTGKSIAEIRTILDDLVKKEVPADELTKGKQLLIRALPQQFETNGQVAGELAELALYGLPETWYDGFVAAVEKVTAKELRKLASQLALEKKMSYVLVGDLAAIAPDLKPLKLGTPRMYDPDGQPIPPAKKGKGK